MNRILGIDLGSYSVKVAELRAGFRTLEVAGLHEVKVAPAARPLDAALDALASLVQERHLAAESVFVGLPGDRLLVRVLDLPFSDPRRLAPVVGFELESQIPHDLEAVVHDHLPGARAGESRSLVPVAAALRAEVAELVERLQRLGLDPRGIGADPFAYATLIGRIRPAAQGPVAWLDVGHRRTNVCVEQGGSIRFARTLSAGGHDVTEALRRALQVRYPEAEAIKHERVSLAGPAGDRAADAARAGAEPLARELCATLAAARVAAGEPVGAAVLLGGASRLAGLGETLSARTGLPVEAAVLDERVGLAAPASPAAALAIAHALRGVSKQPVAEFRRGELAWRGDVSFLRSKVRQIAACVVAVLGLLVIDGFARHHLLAREGGLLGTRLRAETRALFGEEVADPLAVKRRLGGKDPSEQSPVPERSAFDLLAEVSRLAPAPGEVTLDVIDIDIRPGRTQLRATIDSAAAMDALVARLGESDCIKSVEKGRLTDVTGSDLKQFTLTVDTTCF